MEPVRTDSAIASLPVTNLLAMTFSLPYVIAGVPIVVLKDAIGTFVCPMRDLFGVPCPFCGLTRDGSKILHLNLGQTFASKCGQFAILLMVLMSAVFALSFIFRRQVSQKISSGYLASIFVILGVHWCALMANNT